MSALLTPTQTQAVRALLLNPTIKSAASAVGVNERTIRRWMKNPEFRFQVEQSQRDALSQVTARLQDAAGSASATGGSLSKALLTKTTVF